MTDRTHVFLHKTAILALVIFPLLGVMGAAVLLWNRFVFASDIALFFGFYVATGIGVTMGYHRMLTHRSFQAPEWLRGLILILGSMAFEGPPATWAATHIKHHAHSDEDGDPHSPLDGFWHAHLGWMFRSEVWTDVQTYAPQLLADKTVMFVGRFTLLWMVLSLLLPFALGGWTGFVWGGLVRIFVTTHVTWSVNSICHTFGKREFETTDESRNEWIIGLLAFGEGWHNNHHAFPSNAFHGLHWWQFDLSGLLIRFMEATGLAWAVQRVNRQAREAHKVRSLTMQESLHELRASVLSSIDSVKGEIARLGSAAFASAFTEEQRMELGFLQEQATRQLDDLMQAVARSAHLKKQRLLQYQKDAQQVLQECKQRLDITLGNWTAA